MCEKCTKIIAQIWQLLSLKTPFVANAFKKFFLAYWHIVWIRFHVSDMAQVLWDTLSQRYLGFLKIIKYSHCEI